MKGLCKSRLDRMHEVLNGYIERKELPGLIVLLTRHDDVHVGGHGSLSFEDSAPMKRDTLFRIASLTKPVTAVAAMILVEECRLRLDDSIEPWIPELANRRVLRSLSSSETETTPAERTITVRDLLTFRMGFGSILAAPGTHPIQQRIRDEQIGGDGPPLPSQFPAPEEWLRRLGALPWLAQPGARWMYHVSSDVLGVLIARVAGQSLSEFLTERIFEPLGMKDTSFFVTDEDLRRLPTSYAFNPDTNSLEIYDDPAKSAWHSPPPFESGGGGLVSTIDDYFSFCLMLMQKGRFGREQILSRATIDLMTSDQLTPEERKGNEIFFGDYRSWGFGMAVETRRNEIYRTPGRFGWDGGLGTSAYIDPHEEMIGLFFSQRMWESPVPPPVTQDFWTLAYAAMN